MTPSTQIVKTVITKGNDMKETIYIKHVPDISASEYQDAFKQAVDSYSSCVDDESDEDKYAAIADAIEMNENMVKYGTIDEPLTQGQLDYIAMIEWRPDLALWGGDPDCKHEEESAGMGGGTKCKYCSAWFCF